jgi:hypothetical protein
MIAANSELGSAPCVSITWISPPQPIEADQQLLAIQMRCSHEKRCLLHEQATVKILNECAVVGIDHPDLRHAYSFVFRQLLHHGGIAALIGKHFEYRQWQLGRPLGQLSVEHNHVRDSPTIWSCSDSQPQRYGTVPFSAEEELANRRLPTGMTQRRQSFLLLFKRDEMVFRVRFPKIEPASGNQILCRSDRIGGDVVWVQDVWEDAIANVDQQNQALYVVVPRNGM